MAPSAIRKVIGAVKDRTSISMAKIAGVLAPDLEILVVKATSHSQNPARENHIREIVNRTLASRGYVVALVVAVSRRLSKTRNWIVALKCLVLIHRVLVEGHVSFGEEILVASRNGLRVLNMVDFRDEAHSCSWDLTSFVRLYAVYLDEKVEGVVSNSGELREMREMRIDLVVEKLSHLLIILDRMLACRPLGAAKRSRLVILTAYRVFQESFAAHLELSEALRVLFDRFEEMEYKEGIKAFDFCVRAAKMIDDLAEFYKFCREVGIARSSELPDVQRVSDESLKRLEARLKEMVIRPPKMTEQDKNENKALPQVPEAKVTEDLVDLRDNNGDSAERQGNKLELALVSEPATTWEAFSSDWELALVESAANFSSQRPEFGPGLDPLALAAMYELGAVRMQGRSTAIAGLSPGPMQDPFAASVVVPPPVHVQAAEMERRQQLMVQEQQNGIWRGQNMPNGMHGGYYYPPYS